MYVMIQDRLIKDSENSLKSLQNNESPFILLIVYILKEEMHEMLNTISSLRIFSNELNENIPRKRLNH